MVSTARSAEQHPLASLLTLRDRPTTSVLLHETHLGSGVRGEIDLMAPNRWRAIVAPPAFAEHPAAAGAAAPWLRVGVVDALDRWLALPLDQGLVDAERAVVRGRAARMLPPDSQMRRDLTIEALRLARRASQDVAAFLRRLARRPTPPPPGLTTALQDLVDGYSELIGELSGPDRALSSVVAGWQRLAGRGGAAVRPVAGPRPDPTPPPPSSPLSRSLLDPRQLRARMLALSVDPMEPEVELVAAASGDPDAVDVRVRATRPRLDGAPRLLVRLVDRRSGEVGGHAILRPAAAPIWAPTPGRRSVA